MHGKTAYRFKGPRTPENLLAFVNQVMSTPAKLDIPAEQVMAIPTRVTIDDATKQEDFIVQPESDLVTRVTRLYRAGDLNEALDAIKENYMDDEFAEASDETARFGVSAQE